MFCIESQLMRSAAHRAPNDNSAQSKAALIGFAISFADLAQLLLIVVL
jgi:hypothetical protein